MPNPKHLASQVFAGTSRILAQSLTKCVPRILKPGKFLILLWLNPAFATLPPWLSQELTTYRSAKTAREYIQKSKVIHRSERTSLLAFTPKDAKLPPLEITQSPHLTFRSGRLIVEVTDGEKRRLTINNQVVTLPELITTPELAILFAKFGGPTKHARWSPFEEANADSDNIKTGCLSQWEDYALTMSSPHAVLDSPLGYVPHLWIAGMVLEQVERNLSRLVVPTCKHQVRELRKMLADEHLALKDIECDSELSGADRSMTFWLPEFETPKKLKTREFDLDYSRGLASESSVAKESDEDEEEDDKEEVSPETVSAHLEAEAKQTSRLYNFGAYKLREAYDIKSVDGRNKCVGYKRGTPEFERIEGEVEPFRKIFYYVGQNRSCVVCGRELRAYLASPTPPKDLRQLAAAHVREATLKEHSDSAK